MPLETSSPAFGIPNVRRVAAPSKATGQISVATRHSSDQTEYGNHLDNNRGDNLRNDRDDRRDNNPWDGHRRWERTSSGDWYCNDHGHQYRYDGHRFYERSRGEWRVVNTHSHSFDHRIFG